MSVLDPALGGKVYEKVVFVPLKSCATENGVWEERRAIPHGELVCVSVCDGSVAVLWSVMSVKGGTILVVILLVVGGWTDLLRCTLLGFEPLIRSTNCHRMIQLIH
jgi:hypothetical protein